MAYLLEIKLSDNETYKEEIQDVLTLGSDESNSFSLKNHNLAPRHLTFRYQNGVLSVINHVDKSKTLLGNTALNCGKIYLIGKGDTISLGDNVLITVSTKESSSSSQQSDQKKAKDTDQAKKRSPQAGLKKKIRRRAIVYHVNRLGVIGRLYTLFFEIVISTALYIVVVVPRGFSSFGNAARKTVLAMAEEHNIPYREFLNREVLDIFFLYIALNLLSSIFFSATFGQAILNLRTQGNFFLARIKAVLRFLLGLVTGPLLIFDISAFFGWPTLKEILTFSRVGHESNFMRFFGILLLPIISSFIFMIPVLSNYHTLVKSLYIKVPISKRNQIKTDDTVQTFSLHHLTIRASLEENERLLPYFDYEDNQVYPKIMFLDIEKEQRIFYGPALFFHPLKNGLEHIAEVDPLFAKKFPTLYSYLKDKSEKVRERPSINREDYAKELSFLYQSVLSLNLDKIPNFLTTVSPFITPYLEFKKNIMMTLFSSIGGQITEFNVGGLLFFEYENSDRNLYKVFHASELLDRDIVWSASFDQESKNLYKKFGLKFIKRGGPAKLHLEEGIPKDVFNTFDLVDFLYRAKDYKHNVQHYRMILDFFKKRVYDVGNNEYYRNALIDSVRSFVDAYNKLTDIPPERQKTFNTLFRHLNNLLVSNESSEETKIEKQDQEGPSEQ